MPTLARARDFATKHLTAPDGTGFSFDGRQWLLDQIWRPVLGWKLWPIDPLALCDKCAALAGQIVDEHDQEVKAHAKCAGLKCEPLVIVAADLKRQSGKTMGVKGLALAHVFLDEHESVVMLAGSEDQAKRLYDDHTTHGADKSLTIIVDEAHNILSTESFREAESWKDYRLETFEEIIKEGRKFGVFVTIASQRPSDISPTITSQAHNYFIHRLINDGDLKSISSAVSYIDRVMQDSIPTLPTGTCIFSGVATQMPLKINVRELEEHRQPRSETRKFSIIVPEAGAAAGMQLPADPGLPDDLGGQIPF